jgi:hypothetical protein
MTSFATLAGSVDSSRPIELYEFTLGSDVYRYTNAEDDITYGGELFAAVAIAHSRITEGADAARQTVRITINAANALASAYVSSVPSEQVAVQVFSLERDESPTFNTQVLLFGGEVESVDFDNDTESAVFNVRSLEAALGRNVPRVNFGGQCGHFLYSTGCGSNPDDHDYIGTVTLVEANEITVSGLDASGMDFVGGYVRLVSASAFRLVLSQSGDVLTLLLPFSESITGESVQVFEGCDHLIDGHCATKHDRVIDFLGFPFVPNKNVFQTGLD